MKKKINCLVAASLILIYIYSIVFDSFPLSTKIILEGVGLLFCIKSLLSANIKFKKEYKIIHQLLIILMIWDFITSVLNGGSEFQIIKGALVIYGSFFGAHFIYRFFKKNHIRTDMLFHFIVLVVLGESVLAVMMKFIPELYSLMDSILVFDFGDENIEDIFFFDRITGIGDAIYFGVLDSCLIAVMCSVYLLATAKNMLSKFLWIFSWLVISIVSFLTARWAVTVIVISCIYFFYCLKKQGLIKSAPLLIIVGFIGFSIITILFSKGDEALLEWAFDFFLSKGEDTEGTAGTLIDWWTKTKFDFKTFLIGDARWVDPRGGYYMHVDIGVFRQVFYGGIFYFLLNLVVHKKTLNLLYRCNPDYYMKGFSFCLFLGYGAMLMKGNANMMSTFILPLVFATGGIFEYNKSTQNE